VRNSHAPPVRNRSTRVVGRPNISDAPQYGFGVRGIEERVVHAGERGTFEIFDGRGRAHGENARMGVDALGHIFRQTVGQREGGEDLADRVRGVKWRRHVVRIHRFENLRYFARDRSGEFVEGSCVNRESGRDRQAMSCQVGDRCGFTSDNQWIKRLGIAEFNDVGGWHSARYYTHTAQI